MGYEIEFFPVGEGSTAGDAITVRYADAAGYCQHELDSGRAGKGNPRQVSGHRRTDSARRRSADEDFRAVRRGADWAIHRPLPQPLPPAIRRATLVVPSRSVKPVEERAPGRPASPICFLLVGDGRSGQPIALTYELFKAVKELEQGMSVASLPRTVLALLDTTRARLAGPIVRDRAVLDRARVRIGRGGTTIVQRRTGFAARKDGGAR